MDKNHRDLVGNGRDRLPFLDNEVSQVLANAMAANGIRFHWQERATHCDVSQSAEVHVTLTRWRHAGVR
jgi:hypothetical protein